MIRYRKPGNSWAYPNYYRCTTQDATVKFYLNRGYEVQVYTHDGDIFRWINQSL